MDELKIVGAAFKSRKAFESINNNFEASDISPEGTISFDLIREFYETDSEAAHCNLEILIARVDRNIQSNKNAEFIKKYLTEISTIDVSALNIAVELVNIKKTALGMKLAAKLSSGKSDVKELMQKYMELDVERLSETEDEDEYTGVQIQELTQKHYQKENLIQLWPKVLNEQLDGGLKGGNHVVIFAPVEMGKSLFAINACAGFLKQGLRVLYCSNEEPPQDIMLRMVTRLTSMNKYDILEDPAKADSILAKRNWSLFTVASMAPGTFPKIHGLIEKYKAQVLIIDQLRNIDVDSENRTQSLEKAATEARNTAKKYNIPVLSITQAADSATGKTMLTRGDIDGSNIGIPATADVMLGIGADREMEDRNMRVLSFPKQKISGRHQPINITIDPLLSRILE